MRVSALLARLSPRALARIGEAVVRLGAAHVAVRSGTLPSPPPLRGVSRSELTAIENVQRALHRADRLLPGTRSCLQLALTARAMLARRGISTSLHLGAARRAGPDRFHAWLKHEDQFVTGACDERDFALFHPASPIPSLEADARECQHLPS